MARLAGRGGVVVRLGHPPGTMTVTQGKEQREEPP